MPELVHDSPASYPKQAVDDRVTLPVDLIVVLELDATGRVTRASIDTPRGHGFDEAAVVAARGLTFTPARRDGVAIPAKIKFRYHFEPPPPRLSGRVVERGSAKPMAGATVRVETAGGATFVLTTASDGTWSAPELAVGTVHIAIEQAGYGAATTDAVLLPGKETGVAVELEPSPTEAPAGAAPRDIEVTVVGSELAPAVTSMTSKDVRELPGAFGDPFRAIEALPGVTPIVSGLPFFYIRGAPPGNVGYFLDGVRVPYLYHVALGPSVIHPALVDRVDLYPGGYPARFGRFAGGIVAAETTPPATTAHGEASIRLFDAGALAETGVLGDRGTVLVGARYSYTAALISLLAQNVKVDYRDYQLRASYDLSPRDRLTVFGFGAYDLVGQEQPGGLAVLFGSEFYRADLRYDHLDTAGGKLRAAVALGFDQTKIAATRNARDRMLSGRLEYQRPVAKNLTWRSGADTTFDANGVTKAPYADPDDPEAKRFEALFPPRNDVAGGVWTDVVWNATPRVEVTPGLRFDVFDSGGVSAYSVDPRIAARFTIRKGLRIVHAYGLVHQPPSFVLPVPALSPGKLQGGLQSAWQTSAGVEADLPERTTATVTLFQNVFLNMNDAIGTSSAGGFDEALTRRSIGSGVGLEVYVRRPITRRVGGFVSYTLSRSTRSVGNARFPSAFDRTHVLNAALAVDLGRRWQAGGRLVFYTGVPKRVSVGGLVVPPPSSNPDRDPPFYRIDVRLEKRWQLTARAYISFVAEVMNVTLSKETFGSNEIGPITIPSIGVEGGF